MKYLADNGHSMGDYSAEFRTDTGCAAPGIKESKDCESEKSGRLTINLFFSTCYIKLRSISVPKKKSTQSEIVVKRIFVRHYTQ